MAYLQTSSNSQDPAKCISLFYASHVIKYCTVHNSQAQREYCYDIESVRKEEGKFYWKIPLGDDDATRKK